MKIKISLLFFLVFLFSFSGKAMIDVNARLDSVNVLMGNLTHLYLEVEQGKDERGYFPLLKRENNHSGFIGVCGDSVEIKLNYTQDTIDLGSGRIRVNYKVPIQSFDSGSYVLPSFVYISGKDSFPTNQLSLNVYPVNVTADDPIDGFASVENPEDSRFYDAVPDWILDFWWVFLVIAIAIIAFLWAMSRYKKGGSILKIEKTPISPYDQAIAELNALKSRKLWEQGMEKEYFTKLTDILRIYLAGRFGINAMEMTTREIIDKLSQSDVKDKKDYIRQILRVADFVKFAKVRPLPADNIEAFDNAMKFVEETKPSEIEKENSETAGTTSEKGGSVNA